jgi:rare lipoprotein A
VIRAFAVLCALLPAACTRHAPAPPAPQPHYVLGAPYQAGGVWQYPRESFNLDTTGIAETYGAGHPPFTADGEIFDQNALAAAHPTVQLPAIARVTNLENGRQVLVRINDRGPASPHRMLAVTQKTAQLLVFPSGGTARIRLEILPTESRAAIEGLPDQPRLTVAAAPRAAVQETPLGAPGSTPQQTDAIPESAPMPAAPPLKLPETVTQTAPDPGQLWIALGTFLGRRYAAMQRARLAFLHPGIEPVFADGQQEYRVRIGPFATLSDADAALDQAISAGVTDARIVVE